MKNNAGAGDSSVISDQGDINLASQPADQPELLEVKEEKLLVPEILTITHDHRNPFKVR